MKRFAKAALPIVVFGAVFAARGEEPVDPKHVEPVDFDRFREEAYLPGKADAIKNGRIIYEVTGKGMPISYLLLRGTADGQVRLDIITSADVYSACRNRNEYWGYTAESGKVDLPPEAVEEMKIDTPFFPFPFQKNNFYAPLQYTGTGMFGSSECCFFETRPLNQDKLKLTVWIDKATGRLALITSESAEGIYSTSFRNYREFDGIELATKLTLSDPRGVVSMRLVSAEWNVNFPNGIFDKFGDLAKDPRVVEIQKKLVQRDAAKQQAEAKAAADNAAKAKAQATAEREKAVQQEVVRRTAKTQRRIEELQKEIAALDAVIAEKTKLLDGLEGYAEANAEGAKSAAQEYVQHPYVYRHAWSYRGWGHWSGRSNKEAKKTAKRFYRESEKATKEADKIACELATLQLQRNEAQSQLDELLKSK